MHTDSNSIKGGPQARLFENLFPSSPVWPGPELSVPSHLHLFVASAFGGKAAIILTCYLEILNFIGFN